MSDDILLVPVTVEAMAVNEMSENLAFRRWTPNYRGACKYQSAEPLPFDLNDDSFARKEKNYGIYLQWDLPAALRHGRPGAGGRIEYPFVPNRWLVIRFFDTLSRQARAWVVESDALGNECSTPFLDPAAAAPSSAWIGSAKPLQGWSETGAARPPFLTALGPGNPLFSAFEPHHRNVFSFFDDLDKQSITADTLHYLVLGWYAQKGADPLAGWSDTAPGECYEELLARLGWKVADSSRRARSCLFHGLVRGLSWKAKQQTYDPRPGRESFKVAFGRTASEALAALAGDSGLNREAALLSAIEHDLIQGLDEIGGEALLGAAEHRAAFGSRDGGIRWEVVHQVGQGATPGLTSEEAKHEAAVVAALNAAQLELEEGQRELASLQRDLAELAWKLGYSDAAIDPPKDFDIEKARKELDPSQPGTLAERVKKQMEQLSGLIKKVPTAAPGISLEQAARMYAQEHGLKPHRELSPVARPRFWQPSEPVMLIAGGNGGRALKQGDPLACRCSSEVVTAVACTDAPGGQIRLSAIQKILPSLDLSRVPEAATALFGEAFLLDCGAARSIASCLGIEPAKVAPCLEMPKATAGTMPGLRLSSWSPAWLPLYLEWEVSWHPIPLREKGKALWTLKGEDYAWTEPEPLAKPLRIGGRSFLTPKVTAVFRSLIAGLAERYGSGNMKSSAFDLAAFDQWDYLSQTLIGLDEQLLLRQALPHRSPGKVPAALLGPENPVPSPDREGPSAEELLAIRSGHFRLTRLSLVDRFGQERLIVDPSNEKEFKPYRAKALQAKRLLTGQERLERFIEMAPRLLVPARLDFAPISHRDDACDTRLTPETTPVCGWLLPSWLDSSLSVYDPAGCGLGRIAAMTGGQLVWESFPGSGCPELADVAKRSPHLAGFLAGIVQRGVPAFRQLLDQFDQAGSRDAAAAPWDDHRLAVLAGRPVALVRSRLTLMLGATPPPHPAWKHTFEQPPFTPSSLQPPLLDIGFTLRLGRSEPPCDGLIGYFVGNDYARFQPVDGADPLFLLPSAPGRPQRPVFVSMLMDPRAAVRVVSGILPAEELSLADLWVGPALARMEVVLSTGPLLTRFRPVETKPGRALETPIPAAQGTWTWTELHGEVWEEYPAQPADDRAALGDQSPSLRQGLLMLKEAFHKN